MDQNYFLLRSFLMIPSRYALMLVSRSSARCLTCFHKAGSILTLCVSFTMQGLVVTSYLNHYVLQALNHFKVVTITLLHYDSQLSTRAGAPCL